MIGFDPASRGAQLRPFLSIFLEKSRKGVSNVFDWFFFLQLSMAERELE